MDERIPKQISLTYSNVGTYQTIGETDLRSIIIELTEEQRKHIADEVGENTPHFTNATIVQF